MVLADSFYYQPVQIDTINTRVNADLFAKEGDANGRGMVVQITENGIIKDTTGITLRLQWSHISVGTSGFTDFEVVDATKGLYKLIYPTSMLHRGRVEAFIRITDNGILSGTRNLMIPVERMVGSDETIEAADDFSALQTALTKLSVWEGTISGKVEAWDADMEATKQLYIDTLDAAEAAYPQELVSLKGQLEQAATAAEVEVERARISNIVASGTITEGNTELIDTRVGADGITYATAGDATRKQVSSLELTKTNNLFNPAGIVANKRLITWATPNTMTGLYDGAGSYTTPILPVVDSKQYCFVSLGAIVTPGSLISSMAFDVNGNEIVGGLTVTNKIYTLGTGVKYLRFTANGAFAADLCFKEYSVSMSLANEVYGISVSKRLDDMKKVIDTVPTIDTRLVAVENKDVTMRSLINKDNLNKQLTSIGDLLCDFSDASIVTNGQYFSVDSTTKKYVKSSAKIKMPVGTPINTVSKVKKNITASFAIGDTLCVMFYVDWDSVDANTTTVVSPINSVRIYYTKADDTEVETRLNYYELIRGWQMVKIPFTAATSIKAISLYVQTNTVNAITHDVIVNFDSAFKNYKMKPCVLLNFDNMMDANMYGVVYPLVESFGFKGTFYLGGTNALGGAYLTKAHFDEMVDNGWDYAFYAASGSTYGYDSDYTTAYNATKAIIDLRKAEGVPMPIAWFCQNGQTSNTFSKVVKNLGFKMVRGQGQTLIDYFGEDGFETKFNSLDATTTQNKLSLIEGYVNDAITKGSSVSVFTHQLFTTPDDTGINSTVAVWTDFLTFLKTKSDAGLIDVLTYSEFYERCVRTSLTAKRDNLRNMYRIRGLV